jgi:hypothetical protein
MFSQLPTFAITLVVFAVISAIGISILVSFADSQADCASGYTYYEAGTNGSAANLCVNASNTGQTTSPGPASGVAYYIEQRIGSGNSSGMATWTGTIVTVVIGAMLIGALGAFMASRRGR